MESPTFCLSGKVDAPLYPGNHWVLDQACLLIKGANSLLCRAVSNMKLNNAALFSRRQNCKVINLELQVWHSKLLQSIGLHEPYILYAHREQYSNYFLSEARLYASDPVPCFIQNCVKGESLCKPANGHHWLRLVSSSVQSRN